VDDLPSFKDYAMKGRTYRYFEGRPLYPFGFGLSFTKFEYSNLAIPDIFAADRDVTVAVDVQNVGASAGEEVVQLYLTDVDASVPVPLKALQGFERVFLNPGEKKTVRFGLRPEQFSLIGKDLKRAVEPGVFEVSVGGIQPGFKGQAAGRPDQGLTAKIEIR
jgi:beta-glucosidase